MTSIFIDNYRLNAILENFYGGLRMQREFWGLYLHYWKFSKKKIDTL